MEWQLRIWNQLIPHLPAGRVGLWAPASSLPAPLPTPPEVLLLRTALDTPSPTQGAALQALVVLAGATPPCPWPNFLAQLAPLAAPNAPLLVLVPRTGLVALHQAGWENHATAAEWENHLRQAGWPIFTTTLLGGSAWPAAWATAACRLYVAQRADRSGTPLKVQFKRKTSGTVAGTAPATGPLPC